MKNTGFAMLQLWLILAMILSSAGSAKGESLIVGFGKSPKLTSKTGSQASTLSVVSEPTLSTQEVSPLSGVSGILSVSVLSNRARIALVQLSETADPKATARKLLNVPGVAYVEPNQNVSVTQGMMEGKRPNDPMYNDNPLTGWQEIVSLPFVYSNYTRGRRGPRGVKVCIIDTGIDYTHPDLAPNMWINPGEIPDDGIDNDNNGYIDDVYGYNALSGEDTNDPMDDHFHGTHVAGIVGARGNNRIGTAGVVWRAMLIGCKFMDGNGSGSIADAVKCIDYCLAVDADITVNSWGGTEHNQALSDILDVVQEANQLFVAAAGNSGMDVEATPMYPGSYPHPIIMNVAATTADGLDRLTYFSNYGAWSVDIAAPGSAIMSTMPGEEYKEESGTSMACPIVAGAAALLKSYDRHMDAMTMKRLLMGWGDEIEALDGYTLTGRRLNVSRAFLNIDQPLPVMPTRPEPELSPTEKFTMASDIDLVGTTLVFSYQSGDGGGESAGYTVCADAMTEVGSSGWLYNPEGGTDIVNLEGSITIDDDFVEIEFPEDFSFDFYGRRQTSIFAASNGYLTFGRGDTTYSASSATHFNMMRISALFTDLKLDSQSRVSYKMHDAVSGQALVFTYESIAEVDDSRFRQSFQVALLSDGNIKIFYKAIDLDREVIVGLSLGVGIPKDWETDLSEVACETQPSDESTTYELTIENLSFAQPLSRVILATHEAGVRLFQFMDPPSSDLVDVAENGNSDPLQQTLQGDPRVRTVEVLDQVNPGTPLKATIQVYKGYEHILLASKAMNTNDGFVAINGELIALAPEANTQVFELHGLDSGSEENNELCSSIPGPACPQGDDMQKNVKHGNSEGFVHVHRGFHGVNQFLPDPLPPEDLSVHGTPLDAARYDWRNPLARVTISRISDA